MRKVLAALGVAALALVLAVLPGCGSSSSSSPTKDAYLKQVDEICQDGKNQHDKLVYAATKKFQTQGETPKVKEEAALALLGPYEETTQQLAELVTPRGGESKVEALIEARENAAEKVGEHPLSIYEGHPYRAPENLARSANLLACMF